MSSIVLKVKDLKTAVAKLNLAVEKTKLNPKSGWVELESFDTYVKFKVANYDYYLETTVPIQPLTSDEDTATTIHATIVADTFVPLISKLEGEQIELSERTNALIMTTTSGEYTLPIIKEAGQVKSVDSIPFKANGGAPITLKGSDLATIATSNANGLVDSVFGREVQQFIYVDGRGALTFTENIYINDFSEPSEVPFKFLLTATQSKLFEIFASKANVTIQLDTSTEYEGTNKVQLTADNIVLTLVVQDAQLTESFPAIKLRALADRDSKTHVVVNKQALDKALARLMVFDKQWDITVMNYSKLVFKADSVDLVSIRNNNIEHLSYITSVEPFEHESMIRFVDLVRQLKAVNSKEIDISYSNESPAIVINNKAGFKQLIPEIRAVERV